MRRQGQGVLFDEKLALCLLQAKNTTQPGLQQGWKGGGLHMCASVAPNPTAGGSHNAAGTTGGKVGVWFYVCTVHVPACNGFRICVCKMESLCRNLCLQAHTWVLHTSSLVKRKKKKQCDTEPVSTAKLKPELSYSCSLSNLFKTRLHQCYESKLMTVLLMLMLKLWYEHCFCHAREQLS